MIKHLIFDFDGVVADSFDMNWALTQEHDDTATVDDFRAHHDGNVFEEPKIKFKPERLHEYYSEYEKRLVPSHIAQSVGPLKRLAERYQLCIVSSNGEQAINAVLAQSGVAGLFTRVMGVETHASKVEKFKMLMTEYGVTPENALFVSDTLGDVKEAHKVGLRTIAVTFGYHDRERLSPGNPFAIVDSWEEIEQIVSESDTLPA